MKCSSIAPDIPNKACFKLERYNYMSYSTISECCVSLCTEYIYTCSKMVSYVVCVIYSKTFKNAQVSKRQISPVLYKTL